MTSTAGETNAQAVAVSAAPAALGTCVGPGSAAR